jgi:hypothetical protein
VHDSTTCNTQPYCHFAKSEEKIEQNNSKVLGGSVVALRGLVASNLAGDFDQTIQNNKHV